MIRLEKILDSSVSTIIIADLGKRALSKFFKGDEKGDLREFLEEECENLIHLFSSKSNISFEELQDLKQAFERGLSKESIGTIPQSDAKGKYGDCLNEVVRLTRSCLFEIEKITQYPEKRGEWLAAHYHEFPELAEKHLEKLKKWFLRRYGIKIFCNKEDGNLRLPMNRLGHYPSSAEALKTISAAYPVFRMERPSFVLLHLNSIYIVSEFYDLKKAGVAFGSQVLDTIYLNSDCSYLDLQNKIVPHEWTHTWRGLIEDSDLASVITYKPDKVLLTKENPKLRLIAKRYKDDRIAAEKKVFEYRRCFRGINRSIKDHRAIFRAWKTL